MTEETGVAMTEETADAADDDGGGDSDGMRRTAYDGDSAGLQVGACLTLSMPPPHGPRFENGPFVLVYSNFPIQIVMG